MGWGAGIAIDPGIAAMANTSATAMAIQVRGVLFPIRIACKLELIQLERNLANRRRVRRAHRTGLRSGRFWKMTSAVLKARQLRPNLCPTATPNAHKLP